MPLLQLTNWIDSPVSFRIGLTDRKVEGTFVWHSGRHLSAEVAEHWKNGVGKVSREPNNWGDEDCVAVRNSNMYDVKCSKGYGFVCQKRSGTRSLSK